MDASWLDPCPVPGAMGHFCPAFAHAHSRDWLCKTDTAASMPKAGFHTAFAPLRLN